MYCPQCGTPRVEGGKFYTSCGTQFDEVVNNQPKQEITEEIQEKESDTFKKDVLDGREKSSGRANAR